MCLKNKVYKFKPFLLLAFAICIHNRGMCISVSYSSMVASYRTTLSNLLAAITVANNSNLTDFYNKIINTSTYNSTNCASCPSSTNSIYTKLKFFFDARDSQDAIYLNNLYNVLNAARNKLFLSSSTEAPNVANWYTIVGSELTLLNGFSTVLNACSTPSLLLSNIAQLSSYNKTYYQNYPSILNNIFTKIDTFFQTRTTSLQTNIYFLQNLLDLLNAMLGKNFITTNQNSTITSYISTVSSEKSKLDTTLANFQNLLNQYQNSPSQLNSSIISNSIYAQTYLQNYPSVVFSIYTILKNLFSIRETQFTLNQNFINDLQTLLKTASNKPLLTTSQQTDATNWYNTLTNQEIPLISTYAGALNSANDVDSLTKIVQNSAYNRIYFQNYPSSVTCIYTKIQNIFNQRTQTLATQTKLQTLLTGAQNKFFLTGTQITNINSWLSTVTTEINKLTTASSQSTAVTISTSASPSTGSTASATTSSTSPGSFSTFVFDSYVYGQDKVVYDSSKWIAPSGYEGNFAVQFKAKGQKDLYIQIAPQSSDVSGNVYNLVIGGDSNTATWIRNTASTYGSIIGAKITSSTQVITGGLPGDGSTWDNYWVKITGNNCLSWGKGSTIGTNAVASWIISKQTNTPVKYFAFGSYSTAIQISGVNIIGVIGTSADSSAALKSNFVSDLTNATTIETLLYLVNKTDYNTSNLQNIPQQGNSIYTKLKDQFTNRLTNFNNDTYLFKSLPTTISNLQNLLSTASTKNFLTTTQQKDLIACSNTLLTEKNILSQFDTKFAAISSIDDLISVITTPSFNNPILIDYPSVANSIYTQITYFLNIRTLVTNKNEIYLTRLKTLLNYAKNKSCFSNSEILGITNTIPIINNELKSFSMQKIKISKTTTTANITTMGTNKQQTSTQATETQKPVLKRAIKPSEIREKSTRLTTQTTSALIR